MSKIKNQLNRNQRRQQQRAESEVRQKYQEFAAKFLHFFVSHDNPESPEVDEKRKQMNHQWRVYCRAMGLIPEAFEMFEKYAAHVIKEYQDSKQPVNEPATT